MAQHDPHERLISARKARGFETAKDAAEAFGWNVSTYQKHESGFRALSRQAATTYGPAFRVTAAWLLYGEEQIAGKIPIVRFGGAIGAGQTVVPYDDINGTIEGVIGVNGGEAFEIIGDSMLPLARPGDTVFFGFAQPPSRLIGAECLVELTDGVRMFKMIQRGSRPGVYDLLSYNASPLRDVEVVKAGLFLGVKRKR